MTSSIYYSGVSSYMSVYLASQLHTTTTSIIRQTLHAVLNSLVLALLMMGIMMPETC
jgi:hypothetical protein